MTAAAPRVSIVVPVYNVERYLGACLDSVLRQTFGDFELICVDDGSTDGSSAILAEYAARDRRVKVITQANAGLSAARNAGISMATGEYICFIDSDDWIADDAMETCVSVCERDALDHFVFASTSVPEIEGVKEPDYVVPAELCGKMTDGASLLQTLIGNGGYFPAVPLRFMRRKSIIQAKLSFPEGLIHEDVYFTPLAMTTAEKAEATSKCLYFRRIRSNSIMTAADPDADIRHLAHSMAIHVLLGRATESMSLPRNAVAAVRMAQASLRRFLVKNIRRKSTSLLKAYRFAKRLPLVGNERLRLAMLGLRLGIASARQALRSVKPHVRKLSNRR